jgi:1,2-diacylglycerol 3-alpha-glucosyltransferase
MHYSRSMHILMLTDVYFPRINGVSTSIAAFRGELQKLGHRVTLVAPAYDDRKETDPDVVRVPGRTVWHDPEDRLMKDKELDRALDLLKGETFNIVHVQTPFRAHYAGIHFARAAGIPCVETYHTFFEEYLHHYLNFLPRWLTRYAARFFTRRQATQVDLLVVPSMAMQERLGEYGVTTRIRVLPTGLAEEDFAKGDVQAFKCKTGLDSGRPLVLHVGRIAHEKNIDFLVDVVDKVRRILPDVLMIVAGAGPALEHVRRLVERRRLGENVRFLGYLSREGDLQACYEAGDVFVFSSRTETQGLVLLEAMAAGTPVVSTAVMGTRDILGAGRGALVAKDDVNDFSAKVVRLLQDEALRARLSMEAAAYAREWTAPRFAADLAEVYESL